MKTAFAIGNRYRVRLTDENRGRHGYPFDFVIVGPGTNSNGNDDGVHKVCRLELAGHSGNCDHLCSHGFEQTYSHKHLKKCADLVPAEIADHIPVHEGSEGSLAVPCCFCWNETKFWTGAVGGTGCCPQCAAKFKREDLPSKNNYNEQCWKLRDAARSKALRDYLEKNKETK